MAREADSVADIYMRTPRASVDSELREMSGRLAVTNDDVLESGQSHEASVHASCFAGIIGTSEGMQSVFRLITKIASQHCPVLVLGESGTGKELVARAIHGLSPWCEKPFVPVDCGALTPTLIESELFGHVRGAFTGASQTRQGLLAAARGGTIFFDEVSELPLELQPKLLRTLQEREIKPLGSNERTPLEARIIAATNRDLETAMKSGAFRKDLYFRLNVASLKLPPLRERTADIPALVRYLIQRHGSEQSGFTGVSQDAMVRLLRYDWPGNVRELENCVQRALALGTPPEIQVRDLPSSVLYCIASVPQKQEVNTLAELERQAIVQTLEITGGDCQRAAKWLGIGKTTIYRKVKQFGADPSAKGAHPTSCWGVARRRRLPGS